MTYPSAPPTGGDQLTVILDEELIDTATSSGGPLGADREIKKKGTTVRIYNYKPSMVMLI